MPATRIIIDMQQIFPAANRLETVVSVAQEIIQAMRERAHILFVSYYGYSGTHPALLNLTKKYDRVKRINKRNDGGSKEVMRALTKFEFNHRHLRVCGVNADCCVYWTVSGLSDLLPKSKIEMVKNACGVRSEKPYDWKRFVKRPNILLV